MQEKKQPIGVGFFFSLGHSTAVIILTGVIVITAVVLQHLGPFQFKVKEIFFQLLLW